jgi:hypothetical protein
VADTSVDLQGRAEARRAEAEAPGSISYADTVEGRESLGRLQDWFASLRDAPDKDDKAAGFVEDGGDEEDYEPPPRVVSTWDQAHAAVSVGNPRCPHDGCTALIVFVQGADERQKGSCSVHGVVIPITGATRPDDGRYWGDGYSMARRESQTWSEPRRRSAPLLPQHLRVAVRAGKPSPKPKYGAPLDPLDYGSG